MELIKKVTTSPPLPANLLTSVRALTNFFKNESYHDWLLKHRGEVSDFSMLNSTATILDRISLVES